jgi:hypothetical protein
MERSSVWSFGLRGSKIDQGGVDVNQEGVRMNQEGASQCRPRTLKFRERLGRNPSVSKAFPKALCLEV